MDFVAEKQLLQSWRDALYDFEGDAKARTILQHIAPDAVFHMCYPFGDFSKADDFYDVVFAPLTRAWRDLERRDYIVMAGEDQQGNIWVGCAGYYVGTFSSAWLDIPPTGHITHMRFHEFYRVENNKIVEMQALWDIPEVMMQANAWVMAPSLGREWHVPSPSSSDGLKVSGTESQALQTRQHIIDMLTAMKNHPKQPPQTMQLENYWHEKMMWYGPAAIGSARGIAGFRHWHQIPFLNAMPDRGQYPDEVTYHFFAEGDYAGVTGWPDMAQTISHDGWLGIAPMGKKITMRSLDFWRLENGKIRENWVLVDLLDMYQQIGVDIFARLREFNKARNMGDINIEKDYETCK